MKIRLEIYVLKDKSLPRIPNSGGKNIKLPKSEIILLIVMSLRDTMN